MNKETKKLVKAAREAQIAIESLMEIGRPYTADRKALKKLKKALRPFEKKKSKASPVNPPEPVPAVPTLPNDSNA